MKRLLLIWALIMLVAGVSIADEITVGGKASTQPVIGNTKITRTVSDNDASVGATEGTHWANFVGYKYMDLYLDTSGTTPSYNLSLWKKSSGKWFVMQGYGAYTVSQDTYIQVPVDGAEIGVMFSNKAGTSPVIDLTASGVNK